MTIDGQPAGLAFDIEKFVAYPSDKEGRALIREDMATLFSPAFDHLIRSVQVLMTGKSDSQELLEDMESEMEELNSAESLAPEGTEAITVQDDAKGEPEKLPVTENNDPTAD
jgi:hypothetical protein